jgi:hypothetical protein
MKILRVFTLLVGCFVGLVAVAPSAAFGQSKAGLAREAAEYLLRKFGKEAAEVGVETLTRKIESLAIKYGDEALEAVRKVGPRTLRIVDEAGEQGLQAVKLLAKYGDEAVWVAANPKRLAIFAKYGDDAAEAMMKHGEIAEPLLTSFGKPAAGALKGISSQNARRLAMMDKSGDLTKIGRTSELLEIIGRYGDRAADFIWRNKGALAVAAVLTAFIANPEPFLNGLINVTEFAAEHATNVAGSGLAALATEVAERVNWTVVGLCTVCVIGWFCGRRWWLWRRAGSPAGDPRSSSNP